MHWQRNRQLKEFSTFGIGGPISFFSAIETIEEMEKAFSWIRSQGLPFLILGKGSNCLFDDRGFEGAVLLNRIDFIHWENNVVTAGGGTSFSLLGSKTANKGFTGLEFAAGIPASVGGAVWMNAGANGCETQETLREVLYLTESGDQRTFMREDLKFGYRSSPFQNRQGAILAAAFALKACPDARKRQLAIIAGRIKDQPLKEKSVGCIFRNPDGCSAGALIDRAGLKGLSVGGAVVSGMHANFIVNRGGASAADVQELMALVQEKVLEQTNIYLEPEVRIIGHYG